MATFLYIDYTWRISTINRVTLSIVYGVTFLIYKYDIDYSVSLDYKDFSIIPYSVTYPNIVYSFASKYRVTHSNIIYRFGIDYKEFSIILYTLVYNA